MQKLPNHIDSPADEKLEQLCETLRGLSTDDSSAAAWPDRQLDACARAGVFRWFVPEEFGGSGWSIPDLVRGYLSLSSACLTTTFVITQRTAACRRIAGCENQLLKQRYLPPLASGEVFATVGISHLTTSHRHVANPVLKAEPVDGGFLVDGFSPWVTGGAHSDLIVAGAVLEDGREILFVADPHTQDVVARPHFHLVALGGSCTGAVAFNKIFVSDDSLIGGPADSVLTSHGGGAGGFQTSSLALGLARGAIEFIEQQSDQREWLGEGSSSLTAQYELLVEKLLASAEGSPVCSNEELRTDANSLALRATQAGLVAAKGAGFVAGHPAGRWCQEALFFLVWSCPTAVSKASLCELAGLESLS